MRVGGRLAPAAGATWPRVLSTRDPPEVTARPGPVVAGARPRVRAALRRVGGAAARRTPGRWCPALVDGDDAGLDPALADDFRTTGLTHLLAVSGTNLTLVVGFLLVLARWLRVRGPLAATSSARPGSPGSCCSPAPSRACCGPR